jgi:L-alanine-DL-glutamate epimerase-like enolase superfamily enzyme
MKIREVKSHVLPHTLPEAEVFSSSKGWPVAAISAIDIALWDLTGKASSTGASSSATASNESR